MASGVFSILDDVAALMDDVASASKIATRKTAGILGDDLAVNAEKATGFLAKRELPVLWAITKGSFLNKLIIIPIALLLSTFWPVAITIILVFGGIYLAYEGVESIFEFLVHRVAKKHGSATKEVETVAPSEKVKIRSAITTDFVLSAEIVIISLGTVLEQSLAIQILTVSVVSLIATVGVYGIVAIIVRMDDWGYKLLKRVGEQGVWAFIARIMIKMMPWIIKVLRVVGTVALLLVSGGIFVHNISSLHHVLPQLPMLVRELLAGITVGVVATGLMTLARAIYRTLFLRRRHA